MQRRTKSSTVWPDLTKFFHFGKILLVFGQSFEGLIGIYQNSKAASANWTLL